MKKEEKHILKTAKDLYDLLRKEEDRHIKAMDKRGNFSVPYVVGMGNTLAGNLYFDLEEYFKKHEER